MRHVDGFALWPTKANNYSVASSPWRGGKGDLVADFVAAARRAGISPCFYIILGFDVMSNKTGVNSSAYMDAQVIALTELLTDYGQIDRLWLDNYAIGCCQPVTVDPLLYCPGGGTTSEPSPACPGWQTLIDLVRKLSPGTAMIPGPDGCLVNGETEGGTYPLYHANRHTQASYSCTDANAPSNGQTFSLTESDYTVYEPGDHFFWGPGDPLLNASQILAQVNLKLEQGGSLILNVAPNSSGVIPEAVVEQVQLFAAMRARKFAQPRAVLSAAVSAPCTNLSLVIPVNGTFDTLLIEEDLSAGQVIGSYSIETRDSTSGAWRSLHAGVHGKTIGSRLLDVVGPQIGVDALRLNCTSDLVPVPPPPPAMFKNPDGLCMGQPDGDTWPCYTGRAVPGGEVFHLCPLVTASCNGPAAVWAPGDKTGTLSPVGIPEAIINIDCNTCAEGTHAKIIREADCGCGSALTYDVTTQRLAVDMCPGMCLTNGIVAGARPSCAGNETWMPTQIHLASCANSSTQGWVRSWVSNHVDVLGGDDATTVSAAPVSATISGFRAFLSGAEVE